MNPTATTKLAALREFLTYEQEVTAPMCDALDAAKSGEDYDPALLVGYIEALRTQIAAAWEKAA